MALVTREELMLPSLRAYFADKEKLRVVTRIIGCRESRGGPPLVSLRVLDWFLSNYSKAHRVVVNKQDVYVAYKTSLRGHSKALFDPFARTSTIVIKDSEGRDMSTTVAQLSFFRWSISNGIIDHCLTNKRAIELDLSSRGRSGAQPRTKQRKRSPQPDQPSEPSRTSPSKPQRKRSPRPSPAKSPTAQTVAPPAKRKALSKAPTLANVVVQTTSINF